MPSEITILSRELKNRWAITSDRRSEIIERCISLTKSDDPKIVLAAAKVIIAADKLNLDEQISLTPKLNLNLTVEKMTTEELQEELKKLEQAQQEFKQLGQ